ncbi:MAG: DUF2948 family protein [Pseudomonadota bacterium]
MAEDARFEQVPLSDQPLRLIAETAEDLTVISSLLQDAVGKTGEIAFARGRRRLALMLHRFRWEDREAAQKQRRGFERVQSLLTVEGVLSVKARALAPDDGETVFSLLSAEFEAGEDGTGTLRLVLAGDGELVAELECLAVTLEDVSRPWLAKASQAPSHDG